jgi:hypothetical protein
MLSLHDDMEELHSLSKSEVLSLPQSEAKLDLGKQLCRSDPHSAGLFTRILRVVASFIDAVDVVLGTRPLALLLAWVPFIVASEFSTINIISWADCHLCVPTHGLAWVSSQIEATEHFAVSWDDDWVTYYGFGRTGLFAWVREVIATVVSTVLKFSAGANSFLGRHAGFSANISVVPATEECAINKDSSTVCYTSIAIINLVDWAFWHSSLTVLAWWAW